MCWKAPVFHHRATNLATNCVCLANPCVNLFVQPSVTCDYHREILEPLDLLQRIAAYLNGHWLEFCVIVLKTCWNVGLECLL